MKRAVDKAVTIVGFVMMLVLGVKNFSPLQQQFLQLKGHWKDENLVEELSNVESAYRTNFSGKEYFIDLYGVVQHPLGKKIFDNFSIIVDDEGVFHATTPSTYDANPFVQELATINQTLSERGIPLVYIQSPNKEYYNTEEGISEFSHETEKIDDAIQQMKLSGIEVLDMRQIINEKYTGNKSDIFFITDLHMTTDAELWIANEIEVYLGENHNMEFQNQEYLTDMRYYTKQSYPLRGNLIKNVGRYYQDPDEFDIYYPNFDTDIEIYSYPSNDTVEGTFEQVVMNGYQNQEDDGEIYWITNYGRYGTQVFDMVNKQNPQGEKLLIICDSMGFRTFSYMINTVGKVTIADTRFFGDQDWLTQLINEGDYDMVIVYQGYSLFPYSFNVSAE